MCSWQGQMTNDTEQSISKLVGPRASRVCSPVGACILCIGTDCPGLPLKRKNGKRAQADGGDV